MDASHTNNIQGSFHAALCWRTEVPHQNLYSFLGVGTPKQDHDRQHDWCHSSDQQFKHQTTKRMALIVNDSRIKATTRKFDAGSLITLVCNCCVPSVITSIHCVKSVTNTNMTLTFLYVVTSYLVDYVGWNLYVIDINWLPWIRYSCLCIFLSCIFMSCYFML